MTSFLITVQLLLMLPAMALGLMSFGTSRTERRRHSGFVAIASLLAVLAILLALISLSVWFDGGSTDDLLLSVFPPVLTLASSAWVVRRGLKSMDGPRRQRRSSTATR